MFNINEDYNRKALHDKYGGNRQGGIANCRSHPYIFIFTGKAGESHGYEDGWNEENYFFYTGEGQKGDMTFTKGNKSLLNHQNNGKQVFLFENQKKGIWKFIDELTLVDYTYFNSPDTSGELRRGIKFRFKSTSDSSKNALGKPRESINYNKPNKTAKQGLVTSRVGQGWYRRQLLEKWQNGCAVTGVNLSGILIASHIVPWKEAVDEERLDPENGILLSPNLDALFDKYLISFSDKGRIMINDSIGIEEREALGIHPEMKIEITKGMKKYLKRHREKFQKKNNNIHSI